MRDIKTSTTKSAIASAVAAGTTAGRTTRPNTDTQMKPNQKAAASKVNKYLSDIRPDNIKKIANKSNDDQIKKLGNALLRIVDDFRAEYNPKRSLLSKLAGGDPKASSRSIGEFNEDIAEMHKLATNIEKGLMDKSLTLDISEFIIALKDAKSAMNSYHKEFGTVITKG